jgi:hypothetical protein
MRESGFWKLIKSKWSVIPGIKLMRVENPTSPGTPDLCVGFRGKCYWIELKQLRDGWPTRANTIVRIDHYSAEQRLWLFEWGMIHVPAFLLVQVVDHGVYLFDWQAAQRVGEIPKAEFEGSAMHVMSPNAKLGGWMDLFREVVK